MALDASMDRETYVRQGTNSVLTNFNANLRVIRGDIRRAEDLRPVERSAYLPSLLDAVNAVEDALARLEAFSEEVPRAEGEE